MGIPPKLACITSSEAAAVSSMCATFAACAGWW